MYSIIQMMAYRTIRLLVLTLCLTLSAAQPNHPVSIQHIHARCVEPTGSGGSRSVPPNYINAPTSYLFRLDFTIRVPDTFTGEDSSFVVVGSLPDGDIFRAIVRRQDLSRTEASLYWFALDVRVKETGWARFIIDSPAAKTSTDLSVKGNGLSIDLECPEKNDTGDHGPD